MRTKQEVIDRVGLRFEERILSELNRLERLVIALALRDVDGITVRQGECGEIRYGTHSFGYLGEFLGDAIRQLEKDGSLARRKPLDPGHCDYYLVPSKPLKDGWVFFSGRYDEKSGKRVKSHFRREMDVEKEVSSWGYS